MKVVSNTTPIISLASIAQVEVLKTLFGKIHIPESVYQEIKTRKGYGFDEVEANYFEINPVEDQLLSTFLTVDLDRGERDAILLAKLLPADLLLMDERLGYKIARWQSITAMGTLGILRLAKQKGLIQAIKPLFDRMIQNGRWYSPRVYEEFLKDVGEYEDE